MCAEQTETVLAVDDNADSLYALERMLVHDGYKVLSASSGEEALKLARQERPAIILLDIMMPGMDGYQVTEQLKSDPVLRFIPVILLSAKDSLSDIVVGLDRGADGYVSKPFRPEELLARLRAALRLRSIYQELQLTQEANRSLIRQISGGYKFDGLIGESPAMRAVFSLIEKVSRVDSPVLIFGQSGTGKELVARAIHYSSPRSRAPFIAKNCAAFSEHLLESELFGHMRGAFTGAFRDQKGLFEAADKGTLFLDEIGEMSLGAQAKLLRVLQEGTISLVGSTAEKRVDVRVIAATHRDIQKMVDEGRFREDLYYRLNVVSIVLPSLADRRTDISLLVNHFLSRYADSTGSRPKAVSAEAMKMLESHSWRGNVRELENEVERMLILSGEDSVLGPESLSTRITSTATTRQSPAPSQEQLALKDLVAEVERQAIINALRASNGNKSQAAKQLGISRSNLISKVKDYSIED
jgi:DNA-binding NtrC family response regulator